MSKIFRLYKEGASTYQDWNNSPAFPYNSASRDSIEDPDGASARHEITSIPSPFARIDLVKNAFKEVCKIDRRTRTANLDGDSIFHKTVSDTLDVAEIFFNIDKYNGKIEVIKWEPSVMLAELENSDIPGHKYLADALRKYMTSDAGTYNFGSMKNIYLLNYHGTDELNIIGATSPATLFFSNANDLSDINDIYFGDDKPFDSEYQPLYKRDFEFVKYLFALRKSIPNFAGLFPEIDAYLSETYKQITDPAKKNELKNISSNDLDNFDQISVKDVQQNDFVEVLGYSLYKKSDRPVTSSSDFIILTHKESESLPLVLPVDAGNRYANLRYTTAKWGSSNKAPFEDPESDLARRILPYEGSRYPYLTISDFLEDSIVKVPHTLNKTNYFNGHIRIDKQELAFLLPIKPLFFRYFTVDDLMGNVRDGRPMFEMNLLAGDSVSVTLRIPVKGAGNISYIEYSRLYYNNNSADISNNAGNIVEMKFTGFIMPQVHFNNADDAVYNIACVQASSARNEFLFYNGDKKILPNSKSCRNQDNQLLTKADNYLITGSNFDYIQVRNHHGYQGLLIPVFRQQRNIEVFEFAVDLGTSNTHIEYRKGNETPQEFSFNSQDRPLCEMFIPSRNETGALEELIEETDIIEKDFIPAEIGNGDFLFPTRTVLSCAKTVDWDDAVDPFTLVNLPFTYDKRADLIYNNLIYNIKWGNTDDLRVMETYVRCLMLIIRNKVLLNNGDLHRTKITWFYPISMAPQRLGRLKETWDNAYKEYFGEGSTSSMTESAAPIQYFFRRYATATSLVNIDIGGGTTDIAFAKDRSILNVTSFRFASNALFENSFSELDDSNGIVDYQKDGILKLLEEKKLSELVRVFNSANNIHPANMASFLFGLKDNTLPKIARINERAIDFNYILQEDGNFKIVFIVFYTAIIYHIAQIIKFLGLEVPRHISFSGNGSKVLRVITTDNKLLANYTKVIFEKILGKQYGKELELLGLDKDSNPKSTTCKGGIIGMGEDNRNDNTIVFKGDCSGIVSNSDTYASITDSYKAKTIKAVEDFFKFVFEDMNAVFSFDKNFGVKKNALYIAQQAATRDLSTFLDKGLTQRREDTELDDVIEETFFFYPIKGVLQVMSADILNSLRN